VNYAVCEGVVEGEDSDAVIMVLAGYSSTLSLSVIGCWQHRMTPILTSLTLSNLSKPKPSVNDTCAAHSHSPTMSCIHLVTSN